MNPKRRNRLVVVLFLVAGVAVTAGLVLSALSENLNLFYPPDQIAAGEAPVGAPIRAGGMVRDDSVERDGGDLDVRFVVTDHRGSEFEVSYSGILPDLFREGQGVLVQGELGDDGVFHAREVLAKHDENYMPPELADMATAQEEAP
ncbi:MAG: cytochrome c maturation protein CcmE [Pseudomonadota bacterium]